MNVYVTIALHQGVLDEVHVYQSLASANSAEKTWLKDNKIPNREVREGTAQNGTEFFVRICDVEP